MSGRPTQTRGIQRTPRRAVGAAFTLVDVLVSIAVVTILIGLLLPSLSRVQESAQRVICQSNIRQIGLGVVMYADDYRGMLPTSTYTNPSLNRDSYRPQNLLTLRLPMEDRSPGVTPWDGLGLLHQREYVAAAKVYYCPSHHGENDYGSGARVWGDEGLELVANYHFRGIGPQGVNPDPDADRLDHPITRNLYRIDPSRSSLIADGMRIRSDYNHSVGSNFFRADLTVHWYADAGQELLLLLPETKDDATAQQTNQAWSWFDESASSMP